MLTGAGNVFIGMTGRQAGNLRYHYSVGLLILMVVGCLPSRALAQENGAGDKKGDHTGLLSDILAGWQRLEEIDDEIKSCRFECIVKSGERIHRSEGRIGIAERGRLYYSDQTVFSSAPWYGFLLHRTKPGEQSWALLNMFTADQLADPKMRYTGTHPLKTGLHVFIPLSMHGTGGNRLFEMTKYVPITIEKVESRDGDLLTVSYSGTYKGNLSQRGRMVLDTAASYSPVEWSRRNLQQPDVLLEEKRTLVSKQPVRCGSYNYRVSDGGKLTNEYTFTFSDYSDRPPADEELTLAHYGLPEPVGINPVVKRTPTYVWIFAAGGVCVMLAFLFRYLARRRRSAPAVTSPTTPS